MENTAGKLTDALLKLASVFQKHHVNYALIGGLAVGYLSQPRFTKDIDLILTIPQLTLPIVLEELRNEGFDLDVHSVIRDWSQLHLVVFYFEGFRIDWLKPALPLHHRVIETASRVNWRGIPLSIASPEGVILLKLLAFRPQDQLDIESIIASKGQNLNASWIQTEWESVGEKSDPPMKWFLQTYQSICSKSSP